LPASPPPDARKGHLAVVAEDFKGLMEVREVENVRQAIAAALGE
jgi:hypothetical protein